jgi:hypothetical protein
MNIQCIICTVVVYYRLIYLKIMLFIREAFYFYFSDI